MDVKFVNPVLDAIVNVLTMMASMQPQPGKPMMKQGSDALGVVTGMIDFKGPQATVSTAISFTKPVALEITRRMLRTEEKDSEDGNQDSN